VGGTTCEGKKRFLRSNRFQRAARAGATRCCGRGDASLLLRVLRYQSYALISARPQAAPFRTEAHHECHRVLVPVPVSAAVHPAHSSTARFVWPAGICPGRWHTHGSYFVVPVFCCRSSADAAGRSAANAADGQNATKPSGHPPRHAPGDVAHAWAPDGNAADGNAADGNAADGNAAAAADGIWWTVRCVLPCNSALQPWCFSLRQRTDHLRCCSGGPHGYMPPHHYGGPNGPR